YADAVSSDERFDTDSVQWDFIVIANNLTDFAERRLDQAARVPGLLGEGADGVRIWLRTWADLMADCEHRLKFVQDALEYASNEDAGREYLREVHSRYLPPEMEKDDSREPSED